MSSTSCADGTVGASRRFATALCALAACAALLAVAAAPASAVLVRLPNGHWLSYMRITHKSRSGSPASRSGTTPQASASSCTTCDSINHNLDYGGGPVMPSSTNYVIAWIPQGYGGRGFQDVGYDGALTNTNCPGDGCGFMFGVAQYFKDLAANNGQATNSDSVATQYNDGFGRTAAYSVHYGGGGLGPNNVILDTDPLPGGSSGCALTATNASGGDASGSGGQCITDTQIQTELNNFLSAHGLPRGLTNQYFLLTPPDVVTCFDQQGTQCSGNAPGNAAVFCGYHSAGGPANNGFLYANIVDASGTTTSTLNDGIQGCDPFASNGDCSAFVCNYNANFAEGSLSAVSHEHLESTTDPQPPSGWNDDEQNSPHQGGQEIGDLCNNDAADDPNTNYQFNGGTFTDTPYNYTINGHHYWIQMEYSNQGASCQHAMTPESPPGSSFILSGRSGTTIKFNAAGSCGNVSCAFNIGEFVWQFNDAVQQGQPPGGPNFTQTCPINGGGASGCAGTIMTHTFPARGVYNVALTTQLADGRSFGSVRTIVVYNAPGSHPSASGTFLAGTPVRFSSRATHDPALSIASYHWTFGDGSSSTSANPTHTYAHSGRYSVRLTVTDSQGQSGLGGGTLVIAAACHVPNVLGKSLLAARSVLHNADCQVGHVSQPSHKKKGKHLVVSSESPRSGTLVRGGTRINLKLVYR